MSRSAAVRWELGGFGRPAFAVVSSPSPAASSSRSPLLNNFHRLQTGGGRLNLKTKRPPVRPHSSAKNRPNCPQDIGLVLSPLTITVATGPPGFLKVQAEPHAVAEGPFVCEESVTRAPAAVLEAEPTVHEPTAGSPGVCLFGSKGWRYAGCWLPLDAGKDALWVVT